ncbi:MAG: tyrosine-type recombinase/integrase [Paludibacter sp.]|nr:tyrosine-type recombinase/integrase [Bacteroidales bacterium]MCM1068306.1 tyrosine-type recombinase/integrase [Prevotella sp.]MCM1354591.1 tyrosine-type recombinase/integrase [Bacteroides sp.]MCM1442091.1 tyrosine-type recombinase/integrase [Muribaculum sp.]MCM1482015.1 tyrosine-type recombinase/integrase [Paludibacter sp.]
MIRHFLEYIAVERRYSPLTVQAYEHDLILFCEFLGIKPDALDPNKVMEDDIRTWLVELMDAGMGARTVRRKLSSLRSFWKYCRRMDATNKNVTQRIIAPKIGKTLPVFYKESELCRLREGEHFADDFLSVRDNLIIEMLYETGMRRAEMLALDDKDVDFGAKQVRVFGKRRKERVIPLGEPLLEQILLYMDWRERKVGKSREGDALLVKPSGARITAAVIYRVVHERMGEVSTLKKQSPHVLRHTFATVMLNNGADINTIKTLMGHASLAATQIYTHTTFEQVKKVYEKAHPRSNATKTQEGGVDVTTVE